MCQNGKAGLGQIEHDLTSTKTVKLETRKCEAARDTNAENKTPV